MYGETIELQPGCFERQRKVSQSVRWGYATTPKIPRRTFLHNGFDDILCGIHPRELLQIEIWSILMTVSLVLSSSLFCLFSFFGLFLIDLFVGTIALLLSTQQRLYHYFQFLTCPA